MAVQYNSKDDSWSGFGVEIFDVVKNKILGIKQEMPEITKDVEDFLDLYNTDAELKALDSDGLVQWVNDVGIADESLISFLKNDEYAEKTLENFQLYLKDSTKGLTIFQRAGKAAGSALKTLGATLGSMAVNWAIGEIISVFVGIINYSNEIAEKAKELGDEFSNTTSDINSYKEKVEQLQATLHDSTASIQEVNDARAQLYDIQSELISKYGTETDSINAITDAVNGQADAWDRLYVTKWQETKNNLNNEGGITGKFVNWGAGYEDNYDRMKKEYGTPDSYNSTVHINMTGNL